MIDFNSNSLIKLKPINISGASSVQPMLVQGEEILAAFQSIRDQVVFTNKRIISINVQGMTGKKVDYTSMPYSKVQVFSVETSGTLDRDCEIELYFSSVGKVKFEITGSFDIVGFNKTISEYVL